MNSKSDDLSIPTIKILRRKEVTARTGMARSTIYDHMRRGDFPSPIKLGAKIVGWLDSEVEAWLCQQVLKSRGGDR
jgi:prophage regulatory protein